VAYLTYFEQNMSPMDGNVCKDSQLVTPLTRTAPAKQYGSFSLMDGPTSTALELWWPYHRASAVNTSFYVGCTCMVKLRV